MCGTHKHKCDGCGEVWVHSDDNLDNVPAHTCKCGQVQWWKHLPEHQGSEIDVLDVGKIVLIAVGFSPAVDSSKTQTLKRAAERMGVKVIDVKLPKEDDK